MISFGFRGGYTYMYTYGQRIKTGTGTTSDSKVWKTHGYQSTTRSQ